MGKEREREVRERGERERGRHRALFLWTTSLTTSPGLGRTFAVFLGDEGVWGASGACDHQWGRDRAWGRGRCKREGLLFWRFLVWGGGLCNRPHERPAFFDGGLLGLLG